MLLISKGRLGEEAVGEGQGGRWQRDTEVHCGLRLTFIHIIVHRWNPPGSGKQKRLLRISKSYNLPHSARQILLFQRATE